MVIGGLVALWAAVRASQATLHMMNICWAVPRHQRPDPLRSPIRALPLIAIAGLMLLGTTVGTVLATSADAYGVELRWIVPALVLVFSFLVAVLVFALYLYSPEVAELYAHPTRMWLICPLLLYWIGRVLVLANRDELHDDPVIFALTDRVSLLTGVAVAAVIAVSV